MNALTNTPPTMTSREIADLTGKRHPDVKRDIENMMGDLQEDVSKTARIYLDSMNREQTEYALDRELTETLLTGYSAVLRRKVIARWRELEESVVKPAADPMQVLADPAAMRGLLLTYTEKVLTLEATVAEQAPKVAALDRIATGSDGSFCLTDAAKVLQAAPRKFTTKLSELGWIHRRPMGTGWLAYQERIKQGLLEHKTATGEKSDGSEWTSTQVRITAKGIAKLSEIFSRGGALC